MTWLSEQVRTLEQRAMALERELQEMRTENARLSREVKSPTSGDDGLVDVSAAAEFLNMSRSSIYGLMDTGHLRYAKIGKARRIPKKELRALVETNLKGGWAIEDQAAPERL
jgi:excisionase family DNA binding protein